MKRIQGLAEILGSCREFSVSVRHKALLARAEKMSVVTTHARYTFKSDVMMAGDGEIDTEPPDERKAKLSDSRTFLRDSL